ncbi:hypothetical protein ACFCWB_28480 [Streptomyces bacillaris]|uniref:hypothetical protein n=1 Tax=Streptomyces bacillaris TaxID=68179 RepID=UPI0035DBFB89
MTRGTERRMDYAFLGQSPPLWWWDGLTEWLLLEAEELVLNRPDGESAGLLLSGIPSGRSDVIGTRIRYTVVVDGIHEEPALGAWLVRCGLEEPERVRLGRALDAEFAADRVDAWLRGAVDGDPAREVGDRLLAALRKGAAGAGEPAVRDEERRTSWVGGIQDPAARGEFEARAHRLLRGTRPGIAFTTHALGSVPGARRAARTLPGEVAVLLHEGGPEEIQGLSEPTARGAVSTGKARTPVAHRGGEDRRRAALVVVAAVLALVVVLGILLLTG